MRKKAGPTVPVRGRNGKLEWRFQVNGSVYQHITDLADTPRNKIAAMRLEAEARRLVIGGRESELASKPEPFDSAVGSFIAWAKGEYSEHPNSWKRIAVSMTSAKEFFGRRTVQAITHGDVEDYKSFRRGVSKVREVTIRHDLHNLSVFFQYALKHDWAKRNPVEGVSIPSDKDATRDNVLSPADEARYFAAIDGRLLTGRTKERRALQDIRDLSVLMLNQGCRPEELRELQQGSIGLAHGFMTIEKGKSKAARRTLPVTMASRHVLACRLATPGLWVFPSQKFPARHIGQAQRLFESVIKTAGLTMVMYDLRHTFATRAIERGVSLPKLMAVLGHSNLRSIMRYVHISQQHIVDGMREFEESCPVLGQSAAGSGGISGDSAGSPKQVN
jgi:site-specific recombinase XerD